MKILIIHRSFALVGGAERVIIDKANFLSCSGHDVMLVSYEQGDHCVPYQLNTSVQIRDLNCRFFTLSSFPLYKRLFLFFQYKNRFENRLHNVILEYKPQTIVLASDWLFLLNNVLGAAHSIPVVAEFHNAYNFITKRIGNTGNRFMAGFTRLYYLHCLKNFKRCASLVVLTENDARHWRNHSENVVVIPNPVTFYPDKVDDVQKEEGRILCVGRLNAQKRIDRLIKAFSMVADKYPEWHVDVYGEGELRDSLQMQINSCHLESRFILHGATKDIYNEYKKSQMLVLCSEYEGWGLVLVEAMSCGIPCVSFNCPSGPEEIIDDRITGLIAENGNIKDLAMKIEWMIIHDKERKIMGKEARRVAAKYRKSVIMKEWERVYTLYSGLN